MNTVRVTSVKVNHGQVEMVTIWNVVRSAGRSKELAAPLLHKHGNRTISEGGMRIRA